MAIKDSHVFYLIELNKGESDPSVDYCRYICLSFVIVSLNWVAAVMTFTHQCQFDDLQWTNIIQFTIWFNRNEFQERSIEYRYLKQVIYCKIHADTRNLW